LIGLDQDGPCSVWTTIDYLMAAENSLPARLQMREPQPFWAPVAPRHVRSTRAQDYSAAG